MKMKHKSTIILICLLSTFILISCSKGVKGFREIGLGSNIKEVLAQEPCKDAEKLPHDILEMYLCNKVKIENKMYPMGVIFLEGELIRIYIGLGRPDKFRARSFHRALSGTYGKATKSESTLMSNFTNMESSLKAGLKVDGITPNVTWKDGSVQIFSTAYEMNLFYQIPDYYGVVNKANAKKKGL